MMTTKRTNLIQLFATPISGQACSLAGGMACPWEEHQRHPSSPRLPTTNTPLGLRGLSSEFSGSRFFRRGNLDK